MLENIKSPYITKKIFNYIEERIKYKLLKYNKSLQNKININLINYMKSSEKYIIYESKGKGREYEGYNFYFKGRLIFEGEYLNGEKCNIIIKDYYYDSKLEFEGEYLNGYRNGKGKEYDYNGKLEKEKIIFIMVM